MTGTELLPGVRVLFSDGGPDLIEGVINGKPWVYFDGVNAVARVPVFAPEGNRCIDVAGANICRVLGPVDSEPEEAHSIRVARRLSGFAVSEPKPAGEHSKRV